MYKGLLCLPLFLTSLLLPKIIQAHPGRTASDGCHYCRTNCASWGEVEGARHCHGGYSPPPETYTAPVVTIKPVVTATSKPTTTPTKNPTSTPTRKPTSKPTSPPKSTNTPIPESEVKGASDEENTPTPQVLSSTESEDGGGSLATAGIVGVSGLGYYLFRKYKGAKNG